MSSPVAPRAPRSIDWVNAAFITSTPLLALGLGWLYATRLGITAVEVSLFLVWYVLTGLSITGGYHRLWSHRSYDASLPLKMLYLLFGAAALENSVLRWCRDHRIHHSRVDTDDDPYNIMRGGFYAHMGWIYFKAPADRDFKCVPDLLKDRLVLWQDRYYIPIAVVVGFLLPGAVAWALGRPFLGGMLWGGLVRVVIVQHMTFCINSLAHMVGDRPYSLDNTARDSWWLALITYGEGYHNFHHRFAADYRNGYRWYQWDPTKWWIRAMAAVGQARRLVRYRDELVLKARIETDLRLVLERVALAPEGLASRVHRRLEDAREQLERASAQLAEARVRYRRQGRRALREYRIAFQEAKERWSLLIDSLQRLPDAV